MSAETLSLFPREELDQRILNGTMSPYSVENPPLYVDCGDERELTMAHQQTRSDIPARHFGAGTGITVSMLATIIASRTDGHEIARNMLAQYGGIAGLAARISDDAYRVSGIHVNQHSSDMVEGSPAVFKPELESPIGCAYAALAGKVVAGSGSLAVMKTVGMVLETGGIQTSNISYIYDGYEGLSRLIGEDYTVSRDDLHRQFSNSALHTPFAIVRGNHAPNEIASVVYDMHGYKAEANGTEYFHSTLVPEAVLSSSFSRLPLNRDSDMDALKQASLVTGVSTQHALGVERTYIIPENTYYQ